MNIRDITEGPGWDAFKSSAGPGLSNSFSNLTKMANPTDAGHGKPSSGGPTVAGAAVGAFKKNKPGGDDSGGDDKTPSKEPNQNLEYLKLQSAIMKDKKLTPEQKLQKLDQLLQQQIKQGGR